jgi:hypothetical protein
MRFFPSSSSPPLSFFFFSTTSFGRHVAVVFWFVFLPLIFFAVSLRLASLAGAERDEWDPLTLLLFMFFFRSLLFDGDGGAHVEGECVVVFLSKQSHDVLLFCTPSAPPPPSFHCLSLFLTARIYCKLSAFKWPRISLYHYRVRRL